MTLKSKKTSVTTPLELRVRSSKYCTHLFSQVNEAFRLLFCGVVVQQIWKARLLKLLAGRWERSDHDDREEDVRRSYTDTQERRQLSLS